MAAVYRRAASTAHFARIRDRSGLNIESHPPGPQNPDGPG
jgi:hypothetical protein